MTFFGDATPEDAWHPDDPVAVLLDNLDRRAAILGAPPSPAARLAELRERLEAIRARPTRSDLEDVLRTMLAEDLEHVANRLRAES